MKKKAIAIIAIAILAVFVLAPIVPTYQNYTPHYIGAFSYECIIARSSLVLETPFFYLTGIGLDVNTNHPFCNPVQFDLF